MTEGRWQMQRGGDGREDDDSGCRWDGGGGGGGGSDRVGEPDGRGEKE